MASWWVFTGSIVGLAASSLLIVYWLFRLRPIIAKKGWKYTSILIALPWIAILLTSVNLLLKELTVIKEGGNIDITLMYTLAIFNWIALIGIITGPIFDAVKRNHIQTQKP